MSNDHETSGIAIIGIGCRFPGGVNSPAEFWELLRTGGNAITDWPADRYNLEEVFASDAAVPGKSYVRRGGTVGNVDHFDAEFFGISPREARHIDPQQRMLLETAYEALDDAGVSLESISGTKTGVFVGISTHDYGDIQMYPLNREQIGPHSNIGTATSIAANRLSYQYNLCGPSLIVDTACSSALTAVHLACQSIRQGECSLALVGGAQLLLTPEVTVGFCKASMLSPTETCRAFDAGANGYVRSEGAAVIVLKPLAAALTAGDSIYAVIVGSATNQDGHTNGITVPSHAAQTAMMKSAMQQAGLGPNDVHYIEAHGTGTPVGDPIEANAIGAAVGRERAADVPCLIGSVKTNIGHLEAASGIAGIIKTALAIKHRQIPPSLHFESPNPAIDFKSLNLRVVTALEPWPRTDGPATAGVNSFGFGGANAHVLLRCGPGSEATPESPASSVEQMELLLLSARTPEALQTSARAYFDHLMNHPEIPLATVCRTAALRRSHHSHRAALVAGSRDEMLEALEAMISGEQRNDVTLGRAVPGVVPKLAFIFEGMGPQWWGMGRQLRREEPVFRETIERCDALFKELSGSSLLDILDADESVSRVDDADLAQVTNFAIQVALTALWKSWGVSPEAVIGHSGGAMAAAHTAGIHDLAQSMMLTYHRSRLQGRAAGAGSMLAVALSAEEAARAIGDHSSRVVLAAINSPISCALSGDTAALEEIQQTLSERGVFARLLRVDVPYHSQAMDPIEGELREMLRPLRAQDAVIPLVSDQTGTWAKGSEYDGEYWWRAVRDAVRFADGINALIDAGCETFVEVGPHPVLGAAITECLTAKNHPGKILPSIRRMEDERRIMLRSLGALWTQGHPVRWDALFNTGGDFVKLPTYPWQKERHWFTSSQADGANDLPSAGKYVHPLLGARMRSPVPRWESRLGLGPDQWLNDHVIHEAYVYPGAAYVEMALGIAARQAPGRVPVIRDVQFQRALLLRPGVNTLLQTLLNETLVMTVYSAPLGKDENWTLHAQARIETREETEVPPVDVTLIRSRCPRESERKTYYDWLAGQGYVYGRSFQGITRLFLGEDEGIGEISDADLGLDTQAYSMHPALLDAAFQVLIGAASNGPGTAEAARLFLPVGIASVTLLHRPCATMWSHARIVSRDEQTLVGDIEILDEGGRACVQISGLRCQTFEGAAKTGESSADWLYEFRWQPAPSTPSEIALVSPQAALAAASLQDKIDERSVRSGWTRYYETVEARLDNLSAQIAADTFRDLGWVPPVGAEGSLQTLLDELRIVVTFKSLARSLVDILAEHAFLKIEGDQWRVIQPFPSEDRAAMVSALLQSEPTYDTDVELLMRCGGALAGILRGDEAAASTLFQPETMAVLKRFYREAPSSAFYNQILTDAVGRALSVGPAEKVVRLLEIGGGTGSVTSPLLATLPSDGVAYTFTDISPAFVSAAEREFTRPSFKALTLDIERDLADQGFAPHCADVIVAANVFHATADLASTLARVRQLLAPGGLLVLLEITRKPCWLNLIFGVTSGWWKFTDKQLRPHHPLLTTEQWQELLPREGFRDVTALRDTNHPGPSGQTVFLAHATETMAAEIPANRDVGWLILADRGGVGTRLATALARRGELGKVVSSVNELQAAYVESKTKDTPLRGIILLDALDVVNIEGLSADALLDSQQAGCDVPLDVVKALDAEGIAGRLVLVFVTAGAQTAGSATEVELGQTPRWGFARVIMRERLDLRCQLVDLDRERSDAALAALARELCTPSVEEELVLRGENRWIHRLTRVDTPAGSTTVVSRPASPEESWRLHIETAAMLDTLEIRHEERRAPAAHDVEIAVAASSLNFRDVMLAMGMLPKGAVEHDPRSAELGADCAGAVARCGAEVIGLKVGDEVLAISPSGHTAFAHTHQDLVVRKPAGLSLADAAAIPIVFVTAHYSLIHLARLRAGERVLIHAATGGVGLAAIQVARSVGAEIFATAGSPEKRDYLKSLGIEHVMDSRSLAFADEIMARTGGRGVDVVLNSLAGEALTRSVGVLGAYGRFIEIGKRDIYGDSKLGLLALRKNVSFFVFDLDRLSIERPAIAGSALREVAACFENGVYSAIPLHLFPVSEAATAMRFMAQAKHMGKIVLQTDDPQLRVNVPTTRFRSDATYLVTGGLGGFGFATAQWMVREGARSLVLMGRKAPTPDAAAQIALLTAAGVRVETVQGDVSRAEDVQALVARIRSTMPPLRGVFHAAMVLDDASLPQMTWERFRAVLAPKLAGAWNLHLATLTDELDYFVLYSSTAAILGNPMQANYSAANTFLEGLACHRRALGLPALAVNWGVLKDVGYVSQHPEIEQHLLRRGYPSFPAGEALHAFGSLLGGERAQVMVSRLDWEQLGTSSPETATSPSFENFTTRTQSATVEKRSSSLQALRECKSGSERLQKLEEFLREKVARSLGTSARRLDMGKPLNEMGLDSLMAVELTTVLKVELGFELAALTLLQGLTIQRLAKLADEAIFKGAPEPDAATSVAPPAQSIVEVPTPKKVESVPPVSLPATTSETQKPVPLVAVNQDAGVDYAKLDYQRWSLGGKLARGVMRGVFSLGTQLEIEGEENFPTSGPYLLVANHLCLLDVPLVLSRMRRPVVLLADEWLRKVTAARWLLQDVGNAIFVQGDGDEKALQSALAVLRSGGIVGLSPEGARSPTGALTRARSGVAYLAQHAGVPIVPVAAWGHENLVDAWQHLRRPKVHVRVGTPLTLPQSTASASELQARADQVMRALAALLPAGYQGVYRQT